jgi:LAS superfamily LD-carboxypeptidase LdcB
MTGTENDANQSAANWAEPNGIDYGYSLYLR